MNPILKKLVDSASDAGEFARALAESGLRSVSDVFRGVQLFGSLSAGADAAVEVEETHYLLVPLLQASPGYALYTKRILPPGTGAVNSLPKARIFHMPDESGRALLERELIARMVSERLGDSGSSDLAERLEKVADQIDAETTRISGGLVLAGAAVAIVNPLLGVGFAAQALLPSFGARVSRAGVGYVGDKLRAWSKSSAESRLRKDAAKEVQRLEPVLYANPVLRSLDAITTDPQAEFDPFFDQRTWVDSFASHRCYAVTREALREVYSTGLQAARKSRRFQETHLRWIRSCMDPARE